MKARLAYPLMFFLPLVLLGFFISLLAVVGCAGVLWIFVYGDNAWPPVASTVLGIVFFGALMAVVGVGEWMAYRFGKRQEALGGINRSHVQWAMGLGVVSALLLTWLLF